MDDTVLTYLHTLSKQLAPVYPTLQEQEQVAWWLLQKITNKTQAQLLADPILILTSDQKKLLHEWLHEHVDLHKPLQYILGSVPFGTLDILVKPPILIPRPETEEWILSLAHDLKKITTPLTILDICAGSGCIALVLAQTLPTAQIYATDINPQACDLVRKNAQHNKITNVKCLQSDLFQALSPDLRFDLIVSNPPYISQQEWQNLDPMVKDWEDKNALVAQQNGLALIHNIIEQAPKWLKNNNELSQKKLPQLVLEIGYTQGQTVAEFMKKTGFIDVIIKKDLAGKDRIVTGRLKP